MRKIKRLSIFLSVIFLFAAFPPATKGFSLQPTDHSGAQHRVVIRVLRWEDASRQLNMDKNWKVIRKEWRKAIDPVTGEPIVQFLVVREGPADPQKAGKSIPCGKSSCHYLTLLSYDGVGYQGGVTGRIKVYEDVYEYKEPAVVRRHYAPKWAYIWWYRSSPSWTVKDAFYSMGCGVGTPACDTCSGGTSRMEYIGPTFNPMWENSTTTYVYSYYFSGYQPLHADPPLSENARNSNASVFLGEEYRGNVWASVDLK